MMLTPPAPVHFLLVDDREENLIALEALLQRDGLVLLKATSGRQALELLLQFDVALALVDIQMPGMDGLELADLMRGTERTRRVPIIFITAGHDGHDRRFRGYGAGAVDFLFKPIEPDILRSKADVFFELYRQRQEVSRHRDELAAATAENARLLSESRRYAEALKEADRRKDEFLAMLAHELRNPLAPIQNAAQIMRQVTETGPEIRTAAEVMERQVRQMVRLIDDLLDVSRISRGKMELRRGHVDLASIIQNAVEASTAFIDRLQQKLTVDLPSEPIIVDADPTRLAQVVGNLLNNASKFSEERGEISLQVQRDDHEIVIRVRDSGIGIAPDKLHHIFDLFTQLDTSLERRQNGLGIGLTLVKTLVEMHGGTVLVDSLGLGRGCEFEVRLPIVVPHDEPEPLGTPSPTTPTMATVRSKRLLLVDDNRDAVSSFAMLLDLIGYEVHTAFDGLTAVEMADTLRPDVVLLDIGLPRLNGYEAARRIREQPWAGGAVLVALTGWGQEEARQRSREAGFNGHLVKPVDLTTLTALLTELTTPSS